ncbi:MAG: lytic transglycosylase domain-containing protein [Thermoanaerobaculia bacterium]
MRHLHFVLAGSLLTGIAFSSAEARGLSAADLPARSLEGVSITGSSRGIEAGKVENGRRKTLVSIASVSPIAAGPLRTASAPESLRGIIDEASRKYGVDANLISAVIARESAFRRTAVSPVGAKGLMQLMPATARELGVSDPFDARQNVFGGTKYLRAMLDRFRGNVDLALAAYNAGPGAVSRYGGIPPYKETRAYVAAIRASLR